MQKANVSYNYPESCSALPHFTATIKHNNIFETTTEQISTESIRVFPSFYAAPCRCCSSGNNTLTQKISRTRHVLDMWI